MSARLSISAFALLGGLLAAPPGAHAAPSDEVILALGVTRAGRHDTTQSRALQEHLQHAGETLSTARLSPSEKLCSNQACFEGLAQREGATIVLGAQLQENPGGDVYSTVVLFDVGRRIPIYEEGSCEHCSAEDLSTKLGQQADSVLRKYREGRSVRLVATAPVPEVPLVPDGSAGAPTVSPGPGSVRVSPSGTRDGGGYFAQLGLPRLIAGSALTVAGIGLLVPSFYWASQHGKAPDPVNLCNPQPGFKCGPNDLSTGMGLGFASSALLLGGAALVFFLPTQKTKSQGAAMALRSQPTPFARAQ